MKRALIGLMLAQMLLLMGLAGFVAVAVNKPAPAVATMTPLEPPMSRLAGLSP